MDEAEQEAFRQHNEQAREDERAALARLTPTELWREFDALQRTFLQLRNATPRPPDPLPSPES